jgi:hypothetical protein
MFLDCGFHPLVRVIPAKAGVQVRRFNWIHAFAGMTRLWVDRLFGRRDRIFLNFIPLITQHKISKIRCRAHRIHPIRFIAANHLSHVGICRKAEKRVGYLFSFWFSQK